ncbi:MAG: HYR domain-containing protein [Lewinellaceae bacterium]|nr:HYR domain-containing protein [Lewinellaceae bacterium]
MNNSTTPRRWAMALMTFVCLLVSQTARAQCAIGTVVPEPIAIQLIIDPVTGTATLQSSDILGLLFTSPACDPLVAYKISFYGSADKLTPVPDPISYTAPTCLFCACVGGGYTITYDCADVNTTKVVWAAINDGDPGAAGLPGGCTSPDLTSESEAVEIHVTILDKTGPDALAPASVSVSTDPGLCTATGIAGISMSSVVKTVMPLAIPGTYTDNCLVDLNVTYELSGATSSMGEITGTNAGIETFNSGVTTVTYRIYDTKYTPGADPNPRIVSFTVTVTDTENPVFTTTCGDSYSFNTDPGTCVVLLNSNFSAMDNCGVTSFTWTAPGATPSSGSGNFLLTSFPLGGPTTITFTAEDAVGLTATCTAEVTVTDIEMPAISCPSNQTKNTDPGVCTYTAVGAEFDATGMTDNCSITFSATNADNTYDLTNTLDGSAFPLGVTNVTWEVEDVNGNTNTCSFSVTVEDHELPQVFATPGGPVTFQGVFITDVAPGSCSQNVSWYRPNIDACSSVPAPNFFATHCITDNCPLANPNGITEEQPIMPDGFPYTAGSGDFFIDEGVTPYPYDEDNFLHVVTPVNADFPVGTTTLRYFVSDDQGNTASITITVSVDEDELPVATCQPSLTLSLDAKGGVKLTAAQINNGSTDNCGILMMTVSPDTLSCGNAGPNTITLTVTDFNSNTATCTSTVTVVDNSAPVVNCPNNIVAPAGAMCLANSSGIPGLSLTQILPNGAPLTGAGQYGDNCGVTMITYSLSGVNFTGPGSGTYPIPGGVNFKPGVTPVTYTFKDAKGNSTACSFNVTVQDLVAPTATCPADITINANTGGCIAFATWTPPTFIDECDATPTVTSTHAPNSFFFFGTTQVTYTANDDAGNVGTCSFNVVVKDLQAPVAVCKNISVPLGPGGTVTVTASQVDSASTDNCFYNYLPLTLSWSFDCVDLGTNPNPVTLTIVDGQNPGGMPPMNTASCQALITITDPHLPVIVCNSYTPPVVNLDANCSGTLDATAYAANFTISDNTYPTCSLTYEVDVDGSGFAGTYTWGCADAGPNTVTLRVTDVFGNSATCVKTITVQDVTDPIIIDANIIAPPSVTIECDDFDLSDFAALGEITLADVTDACDDACNEDLSISYLDVFLGLNGCTHNFSFERTWTVTDKAGNTTTHVQTLTSVDTEAPTFQNVQTLINLDANDYPACVAPQTVALLDGQIIDNCTAPLVSFFDVYYSIQFPSGPATPFQLTATGSVTTSFPIGTSTVTFDVYDECGNNNQITFTVVVQDVDGPVINEPFGFLFGNGQKVCDSTFTVLNATGNCGNNFSWYRPFRADLDFLDCSTHNVTETIDDPTVQSAINVSAPFIYTNPPVFSVHPTTFFPVGETTITYTATDGSTNSNSSVCSFTVKVVDTQAPDINCPGPQTLSISSACNGTTTVPSYLNGVSVTDNCPNNVILEQIPTAGTLLSTLVNPVQAGQVFTVKVRATDGQPNSLKDSCTFTVTLFDGTSPVPVLPILPVITSFCGKDTVEAPSATDCNGNMVVIIYGTPSVSVLGILPPLTPGGPPRYIIPAGSYAITWSYTDPQNNTTTQLQSVSIFADNIPPIANCKPPFAVTLSAAGEYALSVSEIDNGSFDQHGCGPITLSLNPAILTCANLNSPANVALIVKDVANNVAQCVVEVTVTDITAPVLSPIPANTTLEACDVIPDPANITAVDICDLDVDIDYIQDTTSFSNAYNYTIRRTWTATDDSGNSSTGVQILTIDDTLSPVFASSAPDTITVFTDLNNMDCKDTVAIDIAPFCK